MCRLLPSWPEIRHWPDQEPEVLPQTQEMLDFCAEHNIVSDVELIDIKDIHHAFERMEKVDVRYRFVIDMATINY